MSKKTLSGMDALQALLRGVSLVATATGKTLGPFGRNIVYERIQTNLPISTRDGVTCMQQFDLEDPFENMGARMVRGVSEETVDAAGDGTTTAAILTHAILAEGVKAISVGANPVALKRGIEKAVSAVVAGLKEQAREVEGEMVRQVATISANNDEFLGSLIARAMEASGTDGVVTVEVSRTPESTLEIVDGLQIGTGYVSTYFVNSPERNESVLENVSVFLYEKKLSTIQPMLPFLDKLAKAGSTLLVIAEDITDEALAVLSISAQKGPLRCVAVKTPGGVEHLQDIAALVGAKVVTELAGTKLAEIDETWLGHAAKVVAKASSTTIISDGRERESLARRKQELRTQVTDAVDEGSKLRLQGRLARLAGGIAIIRVGATTELEMMEKRDRIEDAMHATRCAVKEGVVSGGGIALARSCPDIFNLVTDEDELIGISLIRKACLSPLRTLAENGGESPEYILKEVLRRDSNIGWNARTGAYGDMFEMGVIDPLRVVRTALESAASVAGLMLITATLVANDRKS